MVTWGPKLRHGPPPRRVAIAIEGTCAFSGPALTRCHRFGSLDRRLGRTAATLLVLLMSVGGATLLSPTTVSEAGSAGAWLHCSPGSDIADSGGVRGVFVANANVSDSSLAATVLQYLPSDPNNCGASLAIPWSAIDKGPSASPQYDWSYLDEAAAPWEAAGKIVNLLVRGTDEDKTGTERKGPPATPAYVLSSTDTVSCPNYDPTPVYWEPGYQQPWQAFEAALVSHVAGDPNIGYIRFGLGAGGEDFPVDGFAKPECFPSWKAAGLTATKWLEWSTSQIDYEASLGSSHPLNIGINGFPGASDLPGQVVAEAVKYGIGFGMQYMDAQEIQFATSDPESCSGDWCQLFATWAGTVPLEMQTTAPTIPDGDEPPGALPPLLSYVVTQARVQVLELYPQEWLVADDPAWPTYAQYHDVYAQALAQAASEVGGASDATPAPPISPPKLPQPGCHPTPSGNHTCT